MGQTGQPAALSGQAGRGVSAGVSAPRVSSHSLHSERSQEWGSSVAGSAPASRPSSGATATTSAAAAAAVHNAVQQQQQLYHSRPASGTSSRGGVSSVSSSRRTSRHQQQPTASIGQAAQEESGVQGVPSSSMSAGIAGGSSHAAESSSYGGLVGSEPSEQRVQQLLKETERSEGGKGVKDSSEETLEEVLARYRS